MRAKLVKENYPEGAQHDSRAPWNEEDINYNVRLDKDGELVLDMGENDFKYFDPYDIDILLGEKLNIDIEELEEEGESFKIYNTFNKSNGVDIETNHGIVFIKYEELANL